jgi:hypothetical protein
MAAKRTVFISYSHEDANWLNRLRTALAPLTNTHRLDLWDDQRIRPGAKWRAEIDSALAACNAAVLLVSQAFFASAFISKKELPAILTRRSEDGLPVVWIPVSASNYELTPLGALEAAHDPSHPLDTLPVPRRNQALVAVVKKISAAAATSGVGDVLRTTDLVTPGIMSMSTGKKFSRRLGVVTVKREGRVELHSHKGGLIASVDPPDLSRLSEPERQLIATYQASMASAYSRWQTLYPRRDSLTRSQQASLRRAQRQMCDDLGSIIKFLDTVGKPLPDHYRNVRFECGKPQRPHRSGTRL